MRIEYEVENGDRISSTAFKHGFFWETLWNHGSNSEYEAEGKDILKDDHDQVKRQRPMGKRGKPF